MTVEYNSIFESIHRSIMLTSSIRKHTKRQVFIQHFLQLFHHNSLLDLTFVKKWNENIFPVRKKENLSDIHQPSSCSSHWLSTTPEHESFVHSFQMCKHSWFLLILACQRSWMTQMNGMCNVSIFIANYYSSANLTHSKLFLTSHRIGITLHCNFIYAIFTN